MSETILLVEDEQRIIELARMYLEQEGFQVRYALDGASALESIAQHTPALVVLDLMLPVLDGLEVCRRVRANPTTSDLPIIMLTARNDDVDKIVGLELGADDYLTKPFNPRELVARIKAILRRTERKNAPANNNDTPLTFGNLQIYVPSREVRVNGQVVPLRMKEFDLLLTLAENKGVVFDREKLLNIVWGYNFAGETRTVDMHIAHLRHKLAGMTPTIETVWGVGYKFVP